MNKKKILSLLDSYIPFSEDEEKIKIQYINFITKESRCFERDCVPGHLTGSGWLLNKTYDKVLFTHHKIFNDWYPLGGHADGHDDMLEVATRECKEESGLSNITPLLGGNIFDLGIHHIDEYRGMPAHYHYDITFLLKTDDPEDSIVVSKESFDLRWFGLDYKKVPRNNNDSDQEIERMFIKWNIFYKHFNNYF